jgi:hypothetical protein
MDESLRSRVWQRARGICEYCRVPQQLTILPHQIDHIVARKHGGRTAPENLCVACYHCNAHKGPNIAGIDTETGEILRLFHPRRDRWEEHFQWDGPTLFGKTPVGRVTLSVLEINSLERVAHRRLLIGEGVFPPS